jgi:hypothetical protein
LTSSCPGVSRNLLYRSLGAAAEASPLRQHEGGWAVAAGWFAYDHDSRLDPWVVHYAKWSVAEDRYCGDAGRGIRIYCHPKYFSGLANSLYRNRGDGTFEDVTAKAGLAKFPGRGMSVAFADYDGDGWLDVFVTNDNQPNFLFHNLGNGTFEEVALAAGAALRDNGSRSPAWVPIQGLRQRRPPRYLLHRARRRNVPAVPQRRQKQLHRRHIKKPARSADLAAQRLGSRPVRFQ